MGPRRQWRANLFIGGPDEPPLFALGFEDIEAGQAIFRSWKERWDSEDQDKMIRVAIITGLSKRNPAGYAVSIGPNLPHMANHQKKIIVTLPKVLRVPSPSTATATSLDDFVRAYKEAGRFFLAPVWLETNGKTVCKSSVQLAIVKRQLDIREAWQIGDNDPDIFVLNEDDDPIIPAGVTESSSQ